MQGMVEGVRKRGRPKKQWIYNSSDWTKIDIKDLVYFVHDLVGLITCFFKVKCANSPIVLLSRLRFPNHGIKIKIKIYIYIYIYN